MNQRQRLDSLLATHALWRLEDGELAKMHELAADLGVDLDEELRHWDFAANELTAVLAGSIAVPPPASLNRKLQADAASYYAHPESHRKR